MTGPHPNESVRDVIDVLNSEGFEHLVPVVEAMAERLARTSMQLARAEAALLEHGIEPPR